MTFVAGLGGTAIGGWILDRLRSKLGDENDDDRNVEAALYILRISSVAVCLIDTSCSMFSPSRHHDNGHLHHVMAVYTYSFYRLR